MGEPYVLVFMPPAIRALETRIKPAVAFGVYEFVSGPLCRDPRRLGKALAVPYVGFLVARCGPHRVMYRVNDRNRAVEVVAIRHRADAYQVR